MNTQKLEERLEYLRGELRGECISLGELHELQTLAPYISKDDVELLEAAGVPEQPETPRLQHFKTTKLRSGTYRCTIVETGYYGHGSTPGEARLSALRLQAGNEAT